MRKNNLKSLLLLLVMLCMSLTSSAYSFEVDGIYYDDYFSSMSSYDYPNMGGKKCVRVVSNYDTNPYSGDVNIPSTVEYEGVTYSVIGIGGGAFSGCSGLTSVTIPNSVTIIEDWAFGACTSLSSVTIPESVISIGNYAFYGCDNLTSIKNGNPFYDSYDILIFAEKIGTSAFQSCRNLSGRLFFYDSVEFIGDSAFDGCSSISDVYFGRSVSYIGPGAFSYLHLDVLYFATLPNNNGGSFDNTSINTAYFPSVEIYFANSWIFGKGAKIYINQQSIENLVIPNTVTYIPDHAFEGRELTSVSIPSSVTEIGNDAFKSCYNLKKAEFGSIESLCAMKFWGTDSNPLYYTHELYIDGSEIKDLVIPNTVMSIGDYAFVGCSGLTSVTIPNSVTSIGRATFVECM